MSTCMVREDNTIRLFANFTKVEIVNMEIIALTYILVYLEKSNILVLFHLLTLVFHHLKTKIATMLCKKNQFMEFVNLYSTNQLQVIRRHRVILQVFLANHHPHSWEIPRSLLHFLAGQMEVLTKRLPFSEELPISGLIMYLEQNLLSLQLSEDLRFLETVHLAPSEVEAILNQLLVLVQAFLELRTKIQIKQCLEQTIKEIYLVLERCRSHNKLAPQIFLALIQFQILEQLIRALMFLEVERKISPQVYLVEIVNKRVDLDQVGSLELIYHLVLEINLYSIKISPHLVFLEEIPSLMLDRHFSEMLHRKTISQNV
ncbi:hypothetical protein Avbf_08481, partial [Armadillidium vulgare]